MSSTVQDLSDTNKQTLAKFREAVEDLPGKPKTTDEYYLKWLRARDFNLEASLLMLRNHLDWRKKWDADNIFDWKPPEVNTDSNPRAGSMVQYGLHQYLPGAYFGEDREGHPVFYDFLGNLDVKGLYKSCTPDDGFRYKIYQAELGNKILEEQSEKHGKLIETIVSIVNMENLSYQRQYHWQGLQLIRKTFTLFAENYPERTKYIFIIRAPKVFPLAFNLVKHLMHENTQKKLRILGDDYKEVLLKYIAPDQLPAAYGGQRLEPDPECTGVMNWAGLVPESYYLTNQTTTDKDAMDKITIPRGSTHEHKMDVTSTGSILKWEFMTTDYDIGFSLIFESNQGTKTAIVEMSRCNSHVIPVEGAYSCHDDIGTYVFIFSNAHSWLRAKELYYCIQMVQEGDLSSRDDKQELVQNVPVDTNSYSLEEIEK